MLVRVNICCMYLIHTPELNFKDILHSAKLSRSLTFAFFEDDRTLESKICTLRKIGALFGR